MECDYQQSVEAELLTEAIIGCAFNVSNGLGCGFLEKVYENALVYELGKAGLSVQQQSPVTVRYDGVIVGEYYTDLVVEKRVLVELKALRAFDSTHEAQVLNYLKATGLRIGLLLNFGTPRLGIKRMML
jgi:GxxExxY protein